MPHMSLSVWNLRRCDLRLYQSGFPTVKCKKIVSLSDHWMDVGNPKYAEKVLNGVNGNSYETHNPLVMEADAFTSRWGRTLAGF